MDSGLRMDNKDKDRASRGERAAVQGVGRAGWEQRRGRGVQWPCWDGSKALDRCLP